MGRRRETREVRERRRSSSEGRAVGGGQFVLNNAMS